MKKVYVVTSRTERYRIYLSGMKIWLTVSQSWRFSSAVAHCCQFEQFMMGKEQFSIKTPVKSVVVRDLTYVDFGFWACER